jgi:glycosidase
MLLQLAVRLRQSTALPICVLASCKPRKCTPPLLLLCPAGTWKGITNNLDLLQDMGMTAVSAKGIVATE